MESCGGMVIEWAKGMARGDDDDDQSDFVQFS